MVEFIPNVSGVFIFRPPMDKVVVARDHGDCRMLYLAEQTAFES